MKLPDSAVNKFNNTRYISIKFRKRQLFASFLITLHSNFRIKLMPPGTKFFITRFNDTKKTEKRKYSSCKISTICFLLS